MSNQERQIHLIYVSEATVEFEREALHELLARARTNNEGLGITGVLLFVDGFFLQVLEGNEVEVLALFEKISADDRHKRVSKLVVEPIEEREFNDWSMGYADVRRSDLANLPGLNDFFSSGLTLDKLGANRATEVLEAFREGQWRRRIRR